MCFYPNYNQSLALIPPSGTLLWSILLTMISQTQFQNLIF